LCFDSAASQAAVFVGGEQSVVARTMPKAKEPSQPPVKKPRKGEAAFDVWLHRGLHDIYDKVAAERIPDELLKLIEEDRKR
jgi:hypothetical protein